MFLLKVSSYPSLITKECGESWLLTRVYGLSLTHVQIVQNLSSRYWVWWWPEWFKTLLKRHWWTFKKDPIHREELCIIGPSYQPVERFFMDTWKVILLFWWGWLKATLSVSHIFNNSVASCSRSWDCTLDNSRCCSCTHISNQREEKGGWLFIHPSNSKVKREKR